MQPGSSRGEEGRDDDSSGTDGGVNRASVSSEVIHWSVNLADRAIRMNKLLYFNIYFVK